MTDNEIICRRCYHSYVCDEYNANRDLERKQCAYYNDHFVDVDLINRQKAEIERLNKEIETFADIGKMFSEIKAEAVKEFAERLKEYVKVGFDKEDCGRFVVYETDIDNLLKETVGE